MKVFQMIQKLFKIAGIQPRQPNQVFPFNWKNFVTLLFLGLFSLATGAFFVLDAKNMSEFAESFYALTLSLLLFFFYSSLTGNMEKILKLIDDFEETIENRKFFFEIQKLEFWKDNHSHHKSKWNQNSIYIFLSNKSNL